jgi:lipopolysaccharide exporter
VRRIVWAALLQPLQAGLSGTIRAHATFLPAEVRGAYRVMKVGREVAAGAAWMVALKFIERAIGFVSTLVLARLLLPADFGLVAMAMAVFAFVEIAGSFGFDLALIRQRDASRAQYDSAWSLSMVYGALSGVVLLALAYPSARFFNEPRLVPVMAALAAIAFLQGFENIGTVNFRKEFRFGKDFQFMLAKKLIAFVVTLALALTWRNHWALLAGIGASRVSGVALSFLMHPYRPRWDMSGVRDLLRFSRWIVASRIIEYFNDRGPDFMIGRFLDAASLGLYRVAREVATLPTTELLFPVMRAVFPGYAAVAHDRSELARSFLTVQGTIVMMTLPAGIAIVLLADPIVRLLLGPNWLAAIPLIQILGIYGVLTVFQATNVSVFHVLGVPKQAAALKVVEVLLLLPLLAWAMSRGYGLVAAAWAVVAVQALVIPAGMVLIARLLGVGFVDRVRVVWRPAIGALLMAAVIALLSTYIIPPATGWSSAALHLAVAAPAGGVAFAVTVYLLWRAASRPPGPESHLKSMLCKYVRRTT